MPFFLFEHIGDTGPFLLIAGRFPLSLAGLVLPAVLALAAWAASGFHRPRHAGTLVLATFALNVPLLLQQQAAGFPGGGAHLLPLVPLALGADFLIAALVHRPPVWLRSPRDGLALVALAFLALVLPDFGAGLLLQLTSHPGTPAWWGLWCVGGAGWADGLLCVLPLTAVVWIVLSMVLRFLNACKQPARPAKNLAFCP